MDLSPPPGRRDNGLSAADWGALVDLDPRLSEALLASLAAAGVPAYVEPAAGRDSFLRSASLPQRPLDRLWVDPLRADAARAVVTAEVADLTVLLAELDPGATAHGFVQAVPQSTDTRVLTPPTLPERPARPEVPPEPMAAGPAAVEPEAGDAAAPLDHEDAWKRIVEGYAREHDSPVAPWPVSEDVDPPSRSRFLGKPERSGDTPRRRRSDREQEEVDAALPSWIEPEPLEDDGHFVPPPPPPIPRPAPPRVAALAVMALGVVFMFAPGLLQQARTTGVVLFGVLLTVGGAAGFVYLMRDAPSTDSGPDDGAVV